MNASSSTIAWGRIATRPTGVRAEVTREDAEPGGLPAPVLAYYRDHLPPAAISRSRPAAPDDGQTTCGFLALLTLSRTPLSLPACHCQDSPCFPCWPGWCLVSARCAHHHRFSACLAFGSGACGPGQQQSASNGPARLSAYRSRPGSSCLAELTIGWSPNRQEPDQRSRQRAPARQRDRATVMRGRDCGGFVLTSRP